MEIDLHKGNYSDVVRGEVVDLRIIQHRRNQMGTDRVVFPDGTVVKLGSRLHYGMSRVAYECDYVDEQGREYVVKQAHGNTVYSGGYGDLQPNVKRRGCVENLMEYYIYKYAVHNEHAMADYLPVFAKRTIDGEFLLVERCTTFQNVYDEEEDINDAVNELERALPVFVDDMCYTNSGLTHDGREVVLDLGFGYGQVREVAWEVGVPDAAIRRLKALAYSDQEIKHTKIKENRA